MLKKENKSKILIFDIETTPIVGYSWGIYDVNILKTLKEWNMLCFAYKWLGEKDVHVVALPDFKSRYAKDKSDDYDVALALRNLFDEADIVIAHNGDEFDIKKANARFIINGITPPSSYISIDTKKVAKKYFNFDSNSLKDLAKYFDVRRKGDPGGIGTWHACMSGDMDAWSVMTKYNKQDVRVLEDIYMKMRPWMKTHPVVKGQNGQCPKCGSSKLQKRGYERTVSGLEYQRYQCQECAGWSRNRISEGKSTDIR